MPLAAPGEGKRAKRGKDVQIEKPVAEGKDAGEAGAVTEAKSGAKTGSKNRALSERKELEQDKQKLADVKSATKKSVVAGNTSSSKVDAVHSPASAPSGEHVENAQLQPPATKTATTSKPPATSVDSPSTAVINPRSSNPSTSDKNASTATEAPKRKPSSSTPAASKRRRRITVPDAPPSQSAERMQPNRSGRGAQQGNYRGYYHRRLGRGEASADTRLALLDKAWVPADGRVLDVGCNDGAFTVEVARRFAPASVVGVDVDPALVARATQRATDDVAKPQELASAKQPAPSAPNVTFEAVDAATPDETPPAFTPATYDVVVALSVSKWIHLHAGDDGLRRFFARVLASLKPGGVFVLEPQPSGSYKKARRRGAVPKDRVMATFKLKPEQFAQFLVGKAGGFKRFVTLRAVQGKNTPFGNRPVYAFFKPTEVEETERKAAEEKKGEGKERKVLAQKDDGTKG